MMTTLSQPTLRSDTSLAGYASAAQWNVPPDSWRTRWRARNDSASAVSSRAERAERLAALEGQLERRALQVLDQDLDVVRIDARLFDGRAEQERGLARQVLVERRARRDEDADALGAPPPGAAEALPRRRDRARVAGAHHGVELADVDPELERVRGDDAEDLAVAKAPLDVAPLLGEVAAAVGHDARRVDPCASVGALGSRRHRVAQVAEHHLDACCATARRRSSAPRRARDRPRASPPASRSSRGCRARRSRPAG